MITDHGLVFVLVPEVLPLQDVHGPIAVFISRYSMATAAAAAVILQTPVCKGVQ